MKTIEADRILLSYTKANLSMREIFLSIPREVLLKMKKLYEDALQDTEITGDNVCSHCHHLHNNGVWQRSKIRLFLERISQTLKGEWK